MGDKDTNQKRGTPGGRKDYNPLDSRLPEEYLCVVGAPSNTFNGYMYVDRAKYEWVPCTRPLELKEVPAYIKGPLKDDPALTHDQYWANFLDPAVRLYANGIARAQAGDLVTFAVWAVPYMWRLRKDWDASPHNPVHENSPWVRGKPGYDPMVGDGSVPFRVKLPPVPRLGTNNPPPKKATTSVGVLPDRIIDHDILMRTTSDNKDLVIKRPTTSFEYMDYIHKMPRKVVFGPMLGGKPQLENVLVKLLFFNQPDQLIKYINSGAWSGPYWRNVLDTVDERDMGSNWSDEWQTYYDMAMYVSNDWRGRWKRLLAGPAKLPGVDRQKIKIRRMDYIGHSGEDWWYLTYGWDNIKGELPTPDPKGLIDTQMLVSSLDVRAFTRKAMAQLWGCNQGKKMAQELTVLFDSVVACPESTSFWNILNDERQMPEPMYGSKWETYRRK